MRGYLRGRDVMARVSRPGHLMRLGPQLFKNLTSWQWLNLLYIRLLFLTESLTLTLGLVARKRNLLFEDSTLQK